MKIRRGYVRISTGQVHYRTAGQGPPVILLHYSFLSSAMYLGVIERLADRFTVIALDTPGYGASNPLELGRVPEIDDFGDALAETIEALGLESPAVYSSHTSAKFAVSCAWRHPGLIGFLVCDGLAAPETPVDEDYVARHLPPFAITGDGGYIARNWTMMRDFRRFYPWFEPIAQHRMTVDQASLEDDHVYAMSLFSAGPHYASAYGAALRYSPWDAVRGCRTPTVYMAREGDVLAHFLDALEPHLPSSASVERLPAGDDAWVERLGALFSEHARGRCAARRTESGTGGNGRSVVPMAQGDLEVHVFGQARRTVLVLPDPPGAAAIGPLCPALRGRWRVLAPDLPGCGLSDPLAQPNAESYVDALAALLDHFDAGTVAVVAEGLSAPLALAFERRLPHRVSALVLDAAPLLDAGQRTMLADRYCPPIRLSRQGGHMLDVWQRVRDMELQFPWYDEGRGAIRRVDPVFDREALHRRMLGILAHIDHYGDACQAALSIDARALLDRVECPVTILTRPGDPRYPDAATIPPNARLIDLRRGAEAPVEAILSALGGIA